MTERNKSSKWIICRICLKVPPQGKMTKIFAGQEASVSDSKLIHKIKECGGVELDYRSDMPDSICDKCLLLLKAACKFRGTCQRSELQLRKLLQLDITSSVSEVELREDECAVEMSVEAFSIKQETNLSNQDAAVTASEQEALAFVIDEDIVEEYIELQSDFLQEENTENYGSDEISYISKEHEQFVMLKSNDDSLESNREYFEVIAADGVDEDSQKGDMSSQTFEQNPNALAVLETQETYRVVKEFSGVKSTPVNKMLGRKRKSKQAPATDAKKTEYICCQCGNSYNEKAKLTLHMKFHNKDKPHECEICQKRFAQTPQLARHMNSHTGNRPFKCQYCKSSFADPSTRIKHERIHTNERPFKCETCGKTFSYSNVLKVHIMMHTGEKPFACVYCGKKFSQLHHKKDHERTHFPEVEVKSELEPNDNF